MYIHNNQRRVRDYCLLDHAYQNPARDHYIQACVDSGQARQTKRPCLSRTHRCDCPMTQNRVGQNARHHAYQNPSLRLTAVSTTYTYDEIAQLLVIRNPGLAAYQNPSLRLTTGLALSACSLALRIAASSMSSGSSRANEPSAPVR